MMQIKKQNLFILSFHNAALDPSFWRIFKNIPNLTIGTPNPYTLQGASPPDPRSHPQEIRPLATLFGGFTKSSETAGPVKYT